ncbi:MAG: 3-hydroxyacyl-CoA dehydrogenase family protein [Pirellulaceae bacterium]
MASEPHLIADHGEEGAAETAWSIRVAPDASESWSIDKGQRIVIESILERREPKQAVLAGAANRFGDDAILATNTSTIPVADIMRAIPHKERCCGLHFFMPVRQRPLIEIVTTDSTSERTIEVAKRYASAVGKRYLVVRDRPGFVVNRMLVPYLNESVQLLCGGSSAEQIERVALKFGMPMSPFELMDWIGMETNFHAGRAIWQAFPSRIEPSPLTPAMVKAKLKGRAGGEGLYVYASGKRSQALGPTASELVQRYTRDTSELPDQQLAVRLFFPMLIEAACILQQSVVPDLDGIEQAMLGGLGMNADSGFVSYFDELGPRTCRRLLKELVTIGRRYEAPTELMERLEDSSTVSQALRSLA